MLPLRSRQPATGEYRVGRVSARSAAYTVTYAGSRIVDPCSPELAVETLLWHVNRQLVERDAGQHLLLHAAAVVKDDRLAVLPGRSGAGKTTLVAHLLTRGYRYVTDEIVIVDRRTLRVTPYPRTLALSVRSLQALSFERLASPKHLKNPVAVHQLGGTAETQALRPALLAFPQFSQQAGARWENLSPGQALLEAAQHTFDFDRDPQASLQQPRTACRLLPRWQLDLLVAR